MIELRGHLLRVRRRRRAARRRPHHRRERAGARLRADRRRQVDAARRRHRTGAPVQRRRAARRRPARRRQHRAHAAPRARARRRVRRTGPGRRLRHRHRRGGARLRDGAARPASRRRCAAGSRRRSTCSASPTCGRGTCATLSGGQQQRVAIGSVLTMHPRLLVLDEPTSALDPTAAEEVLSTLTRLVHDVGVSVLLAEHRLERVVPFADRMCLLSGDGADHRGRTRRAARALAGGAADRGARPGRQLAPAAAQRPRRPPPRPVARPGRARRWTRTTAPTRRWRSPAAS